MSLITNFDTLKCIAKKSLPIMPLMTARKKSWGWRNFVNVGPM